MKKIILFLTIAFITFFSCTKDESVTPPQSSKKVYKIVLIKEGKRVDSIYTRY